MAFNLLTNVIIGGQTTSGFNALVGQMELLGATVEKIGSHMREFEKESVQVYRSYEDNMLAAEYALSAQYTSATELSKVMQGLDEHASQWAANTIFHTDDVSKAINEASHAGWDYTEIVKGIPQAMLIAQAGSMDLSTGLDYLVKMMGATGTEFDDIGTVIDQWSKAANMSATNIDEMGQAFMSMGASAQFGDSTAELFTLLAVLADVGTTGSQAGTAIRGAMMRIIAPTTKAEDAMSLLGADADELNEILLDENITKAAKKLEGLGFSAYDSSGRLLPMIDIFTNLNDVMQGLDEQSQNEILSAVFPTRNIATAKAFLEAVGNGKMAGLFESIGDSEGYAAKGADIMMSGLTGSMETLSSKWEEFQRQVGETLAPAIEKVDGGLSSIMDSINGMDEARISGLVSGMTALAGLGPVMLGASGIVKAVSALGWKGALLAFAVTEAFALYGYFSKLNEINFEKNFGKMELDLDTLGQHVDSLKTQFDHQQESIAAWEAALESAEESYATKSSALAETLLTDVLTGKTLTQSEIDNINQYTKDLYDAVMDGIGNAQDSDVSFLNAIFGDHENPQQEEVGNTAAQVVTSWYQGLYDEANAIGEELRNQMTEALQDGSLNEAERQAIQSSVDRYNQIMAEIQSQMDAEAYYEQLYKAQSVSWDSISDYMSENDEKQAADLAALEKAYTAKWAHYHAAFDYAIKNGTEFTDLNGQTRKVTEDDWGAFEKEFELEKAGARQSVFDKYGSLSAAAFDALMNDSDFADAYHFVQRAIVDDGSFDLTDVFAGMNEDDLNALRPALLRFANAGIEQRLPSGFFDTEQGKSVHALIQAAKASAYESWSWESTMLSNGWNIVPTQAQLDVLSKQNEIASMTEELERINTLIGKTRARMDEGNYGFFNPKGYHKDWQALYETYGNGVGLIDQRAQLILDIGRAEDEMEALQEKAGESQTMPVIAVVDDTAVQNYTPPRKYMDVNPAYMTAYAEGGRATSASIFGEAGPEWAIPEEHTARTAGLLNAAREASGFTWGDLISRYGGLNANPTNSSVVLHYSPTINAQNADGVANVLRADKARLLKMVKDALAHERLRNDVEVYA